MSDRKERFEAVVEGEFGDVAVVETRAAQRTRSGKHVPGVCVTLAKRGSDGGVREAEAYHVYFTKDQACELIAQVFKAATHD